MADNLVESLETPLVEKFGFNSNQLNALRANLGENFVSAFSESSSDEIDIPCESVAEKMGIPRSYEYISALREKKAPTALLRAFQYQTKEGLRNVFLFAHRLEGDEKSAVENPVVAVYLLNPLERNGARFSAYDVLFLNNEGEVKILGDPTEKRRLVITFSLDSSKREGIVTESELRLRWLETEEDRAMMFHEDGHRKREKNPQTAAQEKVREREANKLFAYNFPKMPPEKIDELVNSQKPQLEKNLGFIVDSEIGAWDIGRKTMKAWRKNGFPTCSDGAFEQERERCLSGYQKLLAPLFQRLPGVKHFVEE